jgi:hypothetical protein
MAQPTHNDDLLLGAATSSPASADAAPAVVVLTDDEIMHQKIIAIMECASAVLHGHYDSADDLLQQYEVEGDHVPSSSSPPPAGATTTASSSSSLVPDDNEVAAGTVARELNQRANSRAQTAKHGTRTRSEE